MKVLLLVATCAAGLGTALSSSAAAQAPTATTSAQEVTHGDPADWWFGLGLTDITADVDPPSSSVEVGMDWKPFRAMGLMTVVGLSRIDEIKTCFIGGQNVECMNGTSIRSAAVGARGYVYNGRTVAVYGIAQVGVQSSGFGRFEDLGWGLICRTLGGFGVGLEARHRFAEARSHANGRVWVFRVTQGFGGRSDSEGRQ